jgi:hypothetical protein
MNLGSTVKAKRKGRCWSASLAVAALAVALVTAAKAQPAESTPLCASLLTAAELEEIAPGSEEMRAVEYAEGHSDCSWMLGGGGDATLSLTFWEPSAVTEALVPADTPEEFFEMHVRSAAEVGGTAGETLEGVGLRSALFRQEGARTVYLLTRAGVAHIVAGGSTDAQVEAVARAVAAP